MFCLLVVLISTNVLSVPVQVIDLKDLSLKWSRILSVRLRRPNKWLQRPYIEALFTAFFIYSEISARTQLTRSPQFRHVRAVLPHSGRSLLHFSPMRPSSFSFYSLPLGYDLWTTVQWPTGQRAATGGKVVTSGPMNGTNALVVTYADVQRDRLSNYPK